MISAPGPRARIDPLWAVGPSEAPLSWLHIQNKEETPAETKVRRPGEKIKIL
jgi:hypothetical protein